MQIHEVAPEELDLVSKVCLDPSIHPKWREEIQPWMEARKEWDSVCKFSPAKCVYLG